MRTLKSSRRQALITGVTGQDGALLAGLLLHKGYIVHGLQRYAATDRQHRLRALIDHRDFHLHYGDMSDGGSLTALLARIRPDEIYNLAAMSHVRVSFDVPEYAASIDALGPLRLLEAMKALELHDTRFYQASSSEMFGNAPAPQNEETPFQPCSPYANAKLFAYWTVRNARETHGLHASNGILFNHESELRGEDFVTRKITRAVAAIQAGRQDRLSIGNLDALRDWGHAADYVEGMWLMLQQPHGDDYVLATGRTHSVKDFIEAAFACIGTRLIWQGHGLAERGLEARTRRELVVVDPAHFRPAEVRHLRGDAAKAERVLGWRPKTGFAALVAGMVAADRAALAGIPQHGDEADDILLEAAE